MADDEDIPTDEEFSFKLSYDEDEELIESLTQAKDNGKLDSHLKNLLRLGHSVYLAATFQTSADSLDSLMKPLDSRMVQLEGMVDRLLTGVQGSSTKGEIGEQIVKGHLQTAFSGTKGDQFESIADENRTMDIRASMMLESSSGTPVAVNALIESKLYEQTVKQKEVDKFWRDLMGSSEQFGLFVSLNKSIANQSDCVKVEVRSGKYAIIVYNENQNQMRHLVAYALLREIAKLVIIQGKAIKASKSDVVTTLLEDLTADIDIITKELSQLGEIETAAGKIIKAAGEHVGTIYKSTGMIRVAIEQGINSINRDISKAAGELSDEGMKLLEFQQGVWEPVVKKAASHYAPHLTAMRVSILAMNELVPMEIDESGANLILNFKDAKEEYLSLEFQSSQISIKFDYDGDVPDGIPGKAKDGQIAIGLNKKAATIGEVNWQKLGEMMLAALPA